MARMREIDMSMLPTKIGMATLWWELRLSRYRSAMRGERKLLRELPILGKLRQIPSTI